MKKTATSASPENPSWGRRKGFPDYNRKDGKYHPTIPDTSRESSERTLYPVSIDPTPTFYPDYKKKDKDPEKYNT